MKQDVRNRNSDIQTLELQFQCYRPALLVILSFMVALLLLVFGTNPWIQGKFIEGAMSPEKLFMGYYRWGILLVVLFFVSTGLVVGVSIYAMVVIFTNQLSPYKKSPVFTLRDEATAKSQTVMIAIVCTGFLLFFDYALLFEVKPFEKMKGFVQECEEIESGNYKTTEVYLHPEHCEKDSLWAFSESSYSRFTSYKAIGDGFSWNKIYVPDYIEFELDDLHPYNEWKDVNWNEENAARYRITYTPNLNVIVKIETLPPNGPMERIIPFSDEISAKGYTRKITDEKDPKWQHNVSHIEFASGSVMDFYWEGPATLGSLYGSTDEIFLYRDPELNVRYELWAWTFDYEEGMIPDAMSTEKETWLAMSDVPYAGGYFETLGDEDKVENTIEKYNGYLQCLVEDDAFLAILILPIRNAGLS